MAFSRRFIQLKGRFQVLRRLFLPKRFSRIGSYSRDTLDQARAFRVLMHAELEAYLEDRAYEIAQKAFDSFRSKDVLSLPVAGIVASLRADGPGVPKQLGGPAFVLTRVGEAYGSFLRVIRNNHGVREGDVLSLLVPLGLDESKIDPAWLATLDGFGASRGAAAHSSGTRGGITYAIDPRTDLNTVQQIMDGLEEIDAELKKIEKSIKQ